ncbi:MAG: hypothetical protein JXR52_13125 [Bacteroidales bacterium]|nr:hypothetical protein [Bacteroidales bacterium]MBN2699761.1 hypothetical protein [Bacteroidales bacterium]
MQKILPFYLFITLLLNLTACKDGPPEKPDAECSEKQKIIGVSVWDRISTRSQPLRSSPRTTLLSLGESFTYLDSFAIDSSYNNTQFLKVRLSDSSVVWVYGFASVLDAKPAVIRNDVPLYLRPDLLTITADRMNAMEIVAVIEEWDNWIKMVNEKKEKQGWIRRKFVSYDTIDLAFALLVKRNLEEEDPEQKIRNLEELLDNNPYPQTIFIPEITQKLEKEKELIREIRSNRDREDRD